LEYIDLFDVIFRVYGKGMWYLVDGMLRSLYRPGSLVTVAWELVRYKLDLVGIQESLLYSGYWVLPGGKASGAWH